jgi:hypothetical protein
MKRWKMWTGGSVAAGLMLAAVVSAQPAPSPLTGAFVFSGGSAQETAIVNAIATATSTLDRATRDDWRARLGEMTRPAPRLALQRSISDFALVDGAGVTLRSLTNATRVALPGDWQMEQRVVNGGAIEQRILNDSIDQLYRYSVSADRRTLTVTARITAPVLSRAIVYSLSYTRQP